MSRDVGQFEFPSEASGPAGPILPVASSFCFQTMLTVPENEELLDFLNRQRDITLEYFKKGHDVKEIARINWNFYATSFEKAKEASGEEMKIKDWRSFVVQTSAWIDCDSDSHEISVKSKQQLAYELEYCTYLKGIKAVIIDLKRLDSYDLIEVLKEFAEKTEYLETNDRCKFSIWVKVPTTNDKCQRKFENDRGYDPWYWWYKFRTGLSNPPYLNVLLDVKIQMGPHGLIDSNPVDRWFGESVVGVTVNTDCFEFKKSDASVQWKGYPYHFLIKAFGYGTDTYYCILYGEVPDDWQTKIPIVDDMHRCLRHCWSCRQEKEQFAGRWYRDSPSRAIHPLTDDVAVNMYNEWETDKAKYECYCQAMREQLHILTRTTCKPVVMVLGAGQGPLIIKLIDAIKHVKTIHKDNLQTNHYGIDCYVKTFEPVIYAVEKNPKAWKLLFRRNEQLWNGKVHLVTGDIRNWRPKVKADLIISEFIGGFGCNELSPECLDSALHLCKGDTRSIPWLYENSLMPVMSRNIMREIVAETKTLNRKPGPLPHKSKTIVGDMIDIAHLEYIPPKTNKGQAPKDGFQHMWISRVYNRFQIGEEKNVFRFVHPNWPNGNDKYITKTLIWKACEDCELTGFVGAFSVSLTKNEHFGTMESKNLERVVSWFPMFVPLKNPVFVKEGSEIELDFSRKADNRKVWYEWQLKKPVKSIVHNQLGLHEDMPTTSDTEDEGEE